MYLNRFSVRINGKSEESGYVEMEHDETYSINLRNDHDVRCDAEVEIDGKHVGTFRIGAKSNLRLERPANEQKKFTFYELGSYEARKSGIDKLSKNEMGLVKVTFKPEKKYVVNEVHHYWHPMTTTTWETPKWTYGDNTWGNGVYGGSYRSENINYCNAGNDSLSGTLGVAAGGGGTQSSTQVRNMSRNVKSSSFGGADMEDSYGGAMRGTRSRGLAKAGGTGLSGHSNQRFSSVAELDYDEDKITEIFVRLVPIQERRSDPVELKPVVKSTPVPPPLWLVF